MSRNKSSTDLASIKDSKDDILNNIKIKLSENNEISDYPLDDPTIIRFLIARDYNLEKSYEMIVSYIQWRRQNNIDFIPMPDGLDNPYLITCRKFYTIPDVNYGPEAINVKPEFLKFYPHTGGCAYHGITKDGQPLHIERVGSYDVKKFAQTCNAESFSDINIQIHEFLHKVVMLECTKRKGQLIEKMTSIFDCSGMGMHQFHIPGISLLKVVADIDSLRYPERLGRLFIINAPMFFTAAWTIIRKFLEKGTLEKIHILGSDYKKVLLKHISHDNLPSFLGGSCTCAHMDGGCVPSPSIKQIKGDPKASRFVTFLDKHRMVHEHNISIMQKGEINFKFKSSLTVHFAILLGTKIIYNSKGLIDKGCINVESGEFLVQWKISQSTASSAKIINLEYCLESISEYINFELNSEEEEIYYDAKEFFWYF